jgi:tetratricopeptide (TPR) repeat protein
MAPEQASGNAKQVGPQADVYALGAILYECLTGRTPFPTGSGWRALVEALDATPVAPSRLRPGVPRDLETVCLKCLEKESARRYPTALELADDLCRFLNNEAVRARPPGVFYQFGKFARRNRVAVAGAAGVFLALVAGLVGTGVGLGREAAARVRAEKAEREARDRLIHSHVAAAELAMQRGAWRVALENLDSALAAGHPDPVRLRLLKARAWLALHDAATAGVELRDLSDSPDLGDRRGEVMLLQADIALARKTDEAGLALVRDALKYPLSPPDEAYARGLLAATVPESVRCFREAVDRDPFHHRANAMVAVLHVLRGELPEARERAGFGAQVFPDDPTFPAILAITHAWEGNAAAAEAEVARVRLRLGDRAAGTTRTLIDLTRAARGLGDALPALDNPLRQNLAIWAFIAAGERAMLELEALRTGKGGLLLPVPPVFVQATRTAASALRRPPGARIEALKQACEIDPDGFLSFFLGIELANERRHAEAEVALRAAVARPSFIPVRRAAHFALATVEWELAGKVRLAIATGWLRAQAVANARRLLEYPRLHRDEARLVAAVGYALGQPILTRAAADRWDRQGGKPDRTILQLLMKVEFENKSYGPAIARADEILARWAGDEAATIYRGWAVEQLTKQADALRLSASAPE